MFIILFISYLIITINGISIEIIQKDFNSSIEKLLLTKENLFVGTINSLHRISTKTFQTNLNSLNLISPLNQSYHWKLLLSINNENLLLCGTINQGVCQIINQDFNFIINSSLPTVANDPINSTIALIIPEENLIYIGVTYTNEGVYRWQIPNISGRSLNLTDFMKIYSIDNHDQTIFRDDLSLRFMPRQQTTFIVQYIYSFSTKTAIYFLSNQPNDIDQTNIITKIIRFCREKSHSIIRSYSELPLVCLSTDWIIQSAQTIVDKNNQLILIGIFRKRDGSAGTNICSWRIENDIETSFYNNYKTCYSMGIGERGLNFIKPNEPCRKDENWSIGMTDDFCPAIISDRLSYPVGGINPILGRLFYENSLENSSAFHLYSYGSIILFFQGLTNGTFKLGIFQFSLNINWIYSYQLSTHLPISSDILFDNTTASFFLASGSTIYRFSLSDACTSRFSCDECLSSSSNVFCGWCSTNERCTLSNNCPQNSWKQVTNQCTRIINVQPLNASIDQSQWINFTLSKLPQLEHNEIYQCSFENKYLSANTQAIILDFNRLSCPTPSNYFLGNESKVRLSIIKSPSNKTIATIPEFIFYNCSSYSSCDSCRSMKICQWCSDRCVTICTEKSSNQCSSNSPRTSLQIDDFSPKILPINGETIVKIFLNEFVPEKILQITLADIPCLILQSTNPIQCQSKRSNSSRQGSIAIFYQNSTILSSKDFIEYRQSSILSFNPLISYEFGGEILHINGNNLIIGNSQEIFLGNIPCLTIKQTISNTLTCRFPSMSSGFYNLTVHIDKQTILNHQILLQVTPNPIIQDINPLISFASGGRLVTIRGMYFGSARAIFVEFSYKKWQTKFQINSNEIISLENGILSSFTFRTPGIPLASNEFDSPPLDLNFSISFDNSISFSNLIQFHYISDILLNLSSIPPTLFYTGEELKLQIENLTDAASIEDIQLFIGCHRCQLKTFTTKGITCQPPNQLTTHTELLLNNQQHQVDCTIYNSSIAPIRFRIGFREYLIGYLSYRRSSRYSVGTIIFLSFASCLLTIALLIVFLCLYIKLRKSKGNLSSIKENENVLWSTTAAAGPYYQVYEQIPSSHENTLPRPPLLICPYHKDYSTLVLKQHFQINLPSLTTISIEHEQLKKLILNSDSLYKKSYSSDIRQSMELFYDLLCMSPFSEAFIDQLIAKNCQNLYQSYVYLFRYYSFQLKTFPLTRQISFLKLISSFFFQPNSNLIETFHLFDSLITNLLNFLDCSPCDQLLNRSMNSLSSSTLLILPNFEYNSIDLSINYENLLHLNLSILDCDSIDQMKEKFISYLNSYEKLSPEQIDFILPAMKNCSQQIPMMKQYSMNSTIFCRKKSSWKHSSDYKYHLLMENQLIQDQKLIEEKLKENKNYFGEVLKKFYEDILQGFKGFTLWEKEIENRDELFKFYIQGISDLIRRLNLLIRSRSTSTILQSCLNVIADGLEFSFQTNHQLNSEIKLLFEEERKYFASFDVSLFEIPSSSMSNSLSLSSFDIRSLILEDDTAIQCLFQLYQFYELHSESINQHIGENHVSVLLPVHHLLVQIRQLINSDTIRMNTTII